MVVASRAVNKPFAYEVLDSLALQTRIPLPTLLGETPIPRPLPALPAVVPTTADLGQRQPICKEGKTNLRKRERVNAIPSRVKYHGRTIVQCNHGYQSTSIYLLKFIKSDKLSNNLV